MAFASSLDQIGPLTKDVRDCAIALNAIAGNDPNDSTSLSIDVPDYTQALTEDLNGLRIGAPVEYFGEGLEAGVESAVRDAIDVMRSLGAEVEETSLPSTPHALAVYYIIAPSEASANLARYDGVKYGFSAQDADGVWDALEKTRQHGFGPEVKRRIMLGTYALSAGYYDAYYLQAQRVRTLIRREFEDVFTRFDAVVMPTSPTVAFKLGEKTADPLQMYLNDILTIPANIAGDTGHFGAGGNVGRAAGGVADYGAGAERRDAATNCIRLRTGDGLSREVRRAAAPISSFPLDGGRLGWGEKSSPSVHRC